MEKTIPVNDLCVGMYVVRLDRPWFYTTLLRHRCLIKKKSQIDKIKSAGIKCAVIDTDKSIDLPEKNSIDSAIHDNGKQNSVANDIELLWLIDSQTLIENTYVDFQLFLKNNQQISPVGLLKKGRILIDHTLKTINYNLLIYLADLPKYEAYIKKIARPKILKISNNNIKNILIRENTKIHVKNYFSDARKLENLSGAQDAVKDLMNAIVDDENVVTELLSSKNIGYCVYAHSVNVAVLSIALGLQMNLSKTELIHLGIGALLHDIGKCKIQQKLLRKKDISLTHQEKLIIQEHVSIAKTMLSQYHHIPDIVLESVSHHHEKLNGTGYPASLSENEISIPGRIIAITDLFDNLTSVRFSRKAMKPFEALSYVRDRSEEYDMAIFINFVKIVGSFC